MAGNDFDELDAVDHADDFADLDAAEVAQPSKMHPGMAAIESLADAVPGTSQLGAGLSMAKETISDITGSSGHSPGWQRTLNHYQKAKGEQEARSRKAQNDAPWTYLATNVAGSIGTAIAGGLAGKMLMAPAAAGEAAALTPAAQNVVTTMGNEAMNVGARANSNTEQIGGTMFGDQLVGALASKVISGTIDAASKRVIPMVLKMPQSMQEKFFHAIGDTRLAKMLADNADTPDGRLLSERVRALQAKIAAPGQLPDVPFTPLDETTIDAADAVGLKLAKAARAGTATVGEGSSYSVTPESGLIDDMVSLGKKTTDDAAQKQWPGQTEAYPFADRKVINQSRLDEARLAGADEEFSLFGKEGSALNHTGGDKAKFKSKKAALEKIFEASGADGYRNYSAEAGHFDEISRFVGREVRDIQDAFNAITLASARKRGKHIDSLDWEDTETAIRMLRDVPGLKDLKLPVDVQEALLPVEKSASDIIRAMPEGSDISFNPAALSKELAEDGLNRSGGIDEVESLLGRPAGNLTKIEAALGKFSPDTVAARAHARWPKNDEGYRIGLRQKYKDFFHQNEIDIGAEMRRRELEAGAKAAPVDAETGAYKHAEVPEGLSNEAAEQATAKQPTMSIAEANVMSKEARGELKRVTDGSADAIANRRIQTDEILDSARHWKTKLKDAERQLAAAAPNKFERERLQGIADKARAELTRINTGRRATERVLGAKTGASLGGAAGAIYGFEKGLPIGKGADKAAEIGARLEQWATRNDNLGRAAKWALQAPGDSLMARVIALSHMPEAQEEIGLEQ